MTARLLFHPICCTVGPNSGKLPAEGLLVSNFLSGCRNSSHAMHSHRVASRGGAGLLLQRACRRARARASCIGVFQLDGSGGGTAGTFTRAAVHAASLLTPHIEESVQPAVGLKVRLPLSLPAADASLAGAGDGWMETIPSTSQHSHGLCAGGLHTLFIHFPLPAGICLAPKQTPCLRLVYSRVLLVGVCAGSCDQGTFHTRARSALFLRLLLAQCCHSAVPPVAACTFPCAGVMSSRPARSSLFCASERVRCPQTVGVPPLDAPGAGSSRLSLLPSPHRFTHQHMPPPSPPPLAGCREKRLLVGRPWRWPVARSLSVEPVCLVGAGRSCGLNKNKRCTHRC